MTVDFKPAQIRIVSFVTISSDRNDSVKIFNHWTSFISDIFASILKSNYAKLLARSIYSLVDKITMTAEYKHYPSNNLLLLLLQ